MGEKTKVMGGGVGRDASHGPLAVHRGPSPPQGRHSHVIWLYMVLFHAFQHRRLQAWKKSPPQEA